MKKKDIYKVYAERVKLYDHSYYERMHHWSMKDKYQWELEQLLLWMDVRPTDAVIDIGCNTGNVVKYLTQKYGCSVYGLDYPEDWVEHCQIRPAIRGDAHRLPLKDDAFDRVFMLHVIGHIAVPEQVLAEAFRILKPGGKLGIITPNAWFVYLMKPLNYLGIIKHTPDPTVLRYFRLRSLDNLFKGNGFELEKIYHSGAFPDLINFSPLNRLKFSHSFKERIICVARKKISHQKERG